VTSPGGGKKRLDVLLVEMGLAPSRERAQALIMAGKVLVKDVPSTKPGVAVAPGTPIRVREPDHPFVSRGGLKLQKALAEFNVSPSGKVCLDVGASTGGFTHCLLLQGAEQVVALDVGENQMAWEVRSNPRVKALEKVNARHLQFEDLGQKFDIIVMDVSFISITKILVPLKQFSTENTDWIILVKPQFEVGKEQVGKGGIVRSQAAREEAVETVSQFAASIGLERMGLILSPIQGTDGNSEYLIHWKLRPQT
jgi:23S rRNA (cytidine1920-2'-O)/16S rRNA (cytidine1409-2'-O)-methyltransferase